MNAAWRWAARSIHERRRTGFSAERVIEILPQLEPVEAARSSFSNGSTASERRTAVGATRPGAAIEIAERTALDQLRQASFKGLRQPASQVLRTG